MNIFLGENKAGRRYVTDVKSSGTTAHNNINKFILADDDIHPPSPGSLVSFVQNFPAVM